MRERRGFLVAAAVAAILAFLTGGSAAADDPAPPRLRLPETAEPAGYAVDLTIDPAQPAFRGSVDIDVKVKQKTELLWLNAKELEIQKASASLAGPVGSRPHDSRRDRVRRVGLRSAGRAREARAPPRVHGSHGRDVDPGPLPPEGRRGLVRVHSVRVDRRAARVPVLRRAVLQGRLAADPAHPEGDLGRLEHPGRLRRGGGRPARRPLRADPAASELPDRASRSARSTTSTPARRGPARSRSASSRRAGRRRRPATRRRRAESCSSASRPTSGSRILSRSSTSSRFRRRSPSAPWRTPA